GDGDTGDGDTGDGDGDTGDGDTGDGDTGDGDTGDGDTGDGDTGDGDTGDGDTGDGDTGDGDTGDGDTGDGDTGDGDTTVTLPDSPDNPWIAFVQIDGAGFGQLFFIKADGTGQHEYSGSSFSESSPAWSPDGDRLAFTAGADLVVLDFTDDSESTIDTGDLERLTRPKWVDDDTIIVSGNEADGDSALWSVDVANGGVTQITSSASGDGGHDVAHDGTVYFVRNDGSFEVWSIDAGASTSDDPTKITDGSNIIGGVTVHPDGSKLLFAASAGDTTDLTEYTLSDDSEAVIGEKGDEQGAYFAGGDGLVVNRDTFDADSEIVVTDGSGTLVTRVTDDSSLNTSPAVNSKESDGMDPTVF
ncbi:MAG: hypothetical protein OXT09_07360, partial [Myxococcales bacterium]|nr:hypothetical protein [Myxococcales bacterium]